ncbi:uncharacterized protein LOC129779665 [Toxorhynchites rutilus septentrionalis]|uniref:uncharacterized protein LOC129779665 n=1 Tax=Toxorhynchites rutilus septentrionalis TaxID=329112 RepID=UPI0024788FAE|nr:uncharacterized protein LOC129779665 [Toxorhynchites rutilus septentrionalis]
MSTQKNVVSVERLDQDFQDLVDSIGKLDLTECEIYEILAPLRWHLFRIKWMQRVRLGILTVIFWLAVYYVPLLNWNVSAIGRLVMVQVLPYWDWTQLYKSRCLVNTFNERIDKVSYYRDMPLFEFCGVCENIEIISKRDRISYDELNEHYLLRSLPVVISDSHRKWSNDLQDFLQSLEPLLLSRPCNLQTNLLFSPSISTKVEHKYLNMLDIISKSHHNDSWFLHFRNCELSSVKKTRLLVGRPYFYASHLEMPYTTWFLMSNSYSVQSPKVLNLKGLIIVTQLKEMLRITLSAKGECDRVCRELHVELLEGQSLVFSTNLWSLEYLPESYNRTSISFVSETFES